MRVPMMMRKLIRDLWQIRTQALAIALVIGSGISLFFGMQATFDSLYRTMDVYYRDSRFADVFAGVKRAPNRLLAEIEEIPGVGVAETRVVAQVTLDIPDMDVPATAQLVSVPDLGRPLLNDVTLTRGRWIDPMRSNEAVVIDAFAEAHGFEIGDRVAAIINGRRKELEIVGVGMSPEFSYLISGGDMFPDEKRFGVLWMARRPLATAFDMEGGFNDVTLTLAPGASPQEVVSELDEALERYGGFGAILREDQVSNWFLQNELTQLASQSKVVPMIFLGVAIFLLNVVLTRIISVQRQQVAVLKALGRTDFEVGLHYTSWAIAIGLLGAVFGVIGGLWLTRAMLLLYMDYFAFPALVFDPAFEDLANALLLAVGGAVLGAATAVRRAVALPPAQAMRPPAPASFRKTWIERLLGVFRLAQPTRIILRNIIRVPTRTALSVAGIAMAVAIMLVGTGFIDAIDELAVVQFDLVQREDVMVTFAEPVTKAAAYDLLRYPGVESLEPMRGVPVILRAGGRSHQTAITGLPREPRLLRVIDAEKRAWSLPDDGLLLSASLAKILDVGPGDPVRIEVREGYRPEVVLPVSATIDDFMGTSAYLEIGAVHRLLRQTDTLSAALIEADALESQRLYDKLKKTPAVAGVSLRQATIDNFNKYLTENMGTALAFNLFFAGVIAFGVVYNTARISLSERARDLASLRVLGFRRSEISYILLGEQALLVLIAIPVGLLVGRALMMGAVSAMATELYRIPFQLHMDSHVVAVITVLVAGAISALVVRRRLDRLDLIEVLKTRD